MKADTTPLDPTPKMLTTVLACVWVVVVSGNICVFLPRSDGTLMSRILHGCMVTVDIALLSMTALYVFVFVKMAQAKAQRK